MKLEKRGEVAIAWLANPPMNAISPDVIGDLGKVWEQVKADEELKAMVVYSSLPVVYSAGADIKAFTKMDSPEKGAELINNGHALLRELGQSRVSTVAAVNAIAYGGGCELAMACDFRVAAESAVFGQPEINLGIIPGFGGTQRLARLVGPSKALEMNLTGDAVLAREAHEMGLADDLVPDEQLLDVAISWARKLAQQAPLAVEQVKLVSQQGRSRRGDRGGETGLRQGLPLRGWQGGHRRVPAEAEGEVAGEVVSAPATTASAEHLARLIQESRCTVALTGAGISVPSGIPDFRTPGTGLWEKVNPMEVAHIDAFRSDPARFWSFYRPRLHSLDGIEPNPAHEALAELERRGLLEAVVTQNIDMLHTKAGSERVIEVHGSIRSASCQACDATYALAAVEGLFDEEGVAVCAVCTSLVKPDVVLFGELLPAEAMAEAEALAARAELLLCVGSSLEVYPVAGLPSVTMAGGGRIAIVTKGPTPYDGDAVVKLDGDVADDLPRGRRGAGLGRLPQPPRDCRAAAIQNRGLPPLKQLARPSINRVRFSPHSDRNRSLPKRLDRMSGGSAPGSSQARRVLKAPFE